MGNAIYCPCEARNLEPFMPMKNKRTRASLVFNLQLAKVSSLAFGVLVLIPCPVFGEIQTKVRLETTIERKLDPSSKIQVIWSDVIDNDIKYFKDNIKPLIKSDDIPPFLSANGKLMTQNGDIYISIALQRACQSGANNFNSGNEPSQCEARIFKIENGRPRMISKGPACLIVTNSVFSSKEKDSLVKNNNTTVAFDPKTKTLKFQTVVNGKVWNDCTHSIIFEDK